MIRNHVIILFNTKIQESFEASLQYAYEGLIGETGVELGAIIFLIGIYTPPKT